MTKTSFVLIIDDEDDIREAAKLSLEMVDGLEVETACSGPEGVGMAAASPPDLILLDVMMPDMDGPATGPRACVGTRLRRRCRSCSSPRRCSRATRGDSSSSASSACSRSRSTR